MRDRLVALRMDRRSSTLIITAILVGVSALFTWMWWQQIGPLSGNSIDFYFRYAGGELVRDGVNPYDDTAFQAHAEKFLGVHRDDGFYYPPAVLLIVLPFTYLGWNAAASCWTFLSAAFALLAGTLVWTFDSPGVRPRRWIAMLVAIVFLLNPLTLRHIELGQWTLLMVAGVCCGQLLIRRGHPIAGAIAWSLVSVKPHLAVPLFAFLTFSAGWRVASISCLVALIANIVAGLMTPLGLYAVPAYIRYVAVVPLTLGMNDVARDAVLSWNRTMLVLGGPHLNLNVTLTMLGFATMAAIFVARSRKSMCSDRLEERFAATRFLLCGAGISSILCAQSKGYDALLMVLTVPFLIDLWQCRMRAVLFLLLILLAIMIIPRSIVEFVAHYADVPKYFSAELLLSYRSISLCIFAIVIIIAGMPSSATASSPSGS